ncbi:hypothetical protein F0562_022611 [Nyssa sinensis]|uniref:Uncharacterized protein n=1 Tax=Nyssa sinensis TaxID=561372 RepID=A0A5J5BP22_9ASTE|nr:hypothetical protein F0562_022611 [Nyssa sinensis]
MEMKGATALRGGYGDEVEGAMMMVEVESAVGGDDGGAGYSESDGGGGAAVVRERQVGAVEIDKDAVGGGDGNDRRCADSALYATENSRLPQSYSVLQQNTQATPLHTNSSTSAVASQAISTCHLAVAPFHVQGDALATNTTNRPAIRSSASAAGVHSVEGSFGDGVPITCSASAVCTREATSNTNGLEPTIHSLRDIPNAFSDAVCPVANQIGANASQPESSTKFTEQQKTSYAIQPIKSMEIGTTCSDPLLDCLDILQRDSYQNPTGQIMATTSNQHPSLLLHNEDMRSRDVVVLENDEGFDGNSGDELDDDSER